jgi:hypothetical protein
MRLPRGLLELVMRLTAHGLVNPIVGIDLLTLAWAFRRRGWWKRPPFLPVPDAEYLAWRMHTAYGEERSLPPVEDVIRFAHWRRRMLSG